MIEDIFFIIDKTNALLRATGWEMLTISAMVDPVNLIIKITARLNGEVIGTTQLPDRLFADDYINNQKKLVVKLHEFAIISYDAITHPPTALPEPHEPN